MAALLWNFRLDTLYMEAPDVTWLTRLTGAAQSLVRLVSAKHRQPVSGDYWDSRLLCIYYTYTEIPPTPS